jgi:hypothetical protein
VTVSHCTMNAPEDLIVAAIAAPRFRGRKRCIELAYAGDATALRALSLSPREREIAALRGELSEPVTHALALPSVHAAFRKRLERSAARCDFLAERKPGEARTRATFEIFYQRRAVAGFRVTKHGHESRIVIVEPGRETVDAHTCRVWPRHVGLPDHYRYRVTCSEHVWHISPRILAAPPAAPGILYLAPNVRVRQGRGTDLVLERKEGRRWTR